MSNEEDTFNKLKRPTLHQMAALVSDFYQNNPQAGATDCEPLLLNNHWTLEEYTETYNNQVGQLMRALDILND